MRSSDLKTEIELRDKIDEMREHFKEMEKQLGRQISLLESIHGRESPLLKVAKLFTDQLECFRYRHLKP